MVGVDSAQVDAQLMPNNRKRKKKHGTAASQARDLKRSLRRADGRSAKTGEAVVISERHLHVV